MKKYISLLLSTFFRKKDEVINDENNNEDYNVLYGEDGDKYNDEIINENDNINKESNINNSLNEKLVPNKSFHHSKTIRKLLNLK